MISEKLKHILSTIGLLATLFTITRAENIEILTIDGFPVNTVTVDAALKWDGDEKELKNTGYSALVKYLKMYKKYQKYAEVFFPKDGLTNQLMDTFAKPTLYATEVYNKNYEIAIVKAFGKLLGLSSEACDKVETYHDVVDALIEKNKHQYPVSDSDLRSYTNTYEISYLSFPHTIKERTVLSMLSIAKKHGSLKKAEQYINRISKIKREIKNTSFKFIIPKTPLKAKTFLYLEYENKNIFPGNAYLPLDELFTYYKGRDHDESEGFHQSRYLCIWYVKKITKMPENEFKQRYEQIKKEFIYDKYIRNKLKDVAEAYWKEVKIESPLLLKYSFNLMSIDGLLEFSDFSKKERTFENLFSRALLEGQDENIQELQKGLSKVKDKLHKVKKELTPGDTNSLTYWITIAESILASLQYPLVNKFDAGHAVGIDFYQQSLMQLTEYPVFPSIVYWELAKSYVAEKSLNASIYLDKYLERRKDSNDTRGVSEEDIQEFIKELKEKGLRI